MLDFQAYSRPLVKVLEFKYIGRVMTVSDDDWPEVVVNLRKSRRRWERISRILGRYGEYPRTLGDFNKAVVQYNLLFGAESWVMSPWIGRTLGGFHHRVAHRLEKCRRRGPGG